MENTWQEFRISFGDTPDSLAEELMALVAMIEGVCGCEQTGTIDETARPNWRVYLDAAAISEAFRKHFQEATATLGITDVHMEGPFRLDRQNWHDGWRVYFKPVMLGQRLAIVPSWDDTAAELAEREGRIVLRLEPGMAFGTGTHATTQLCLELAEEIFTAGNNAQVLDIGTGSGVLAVAAIKLGAAHCEAVDTDPEVEENLVENLRLNGVSRDQVNLVVGKLKDTAPGPYDLIFCNMLLHEFTPLLPDLPARLAPTGTLLLSGLLATEHNEVLNSLESLPLRVERTRQSGEWEAMVIRPK